MTPEPTPGIGISTYATMSDVVGKRMPATQLAKLYGELDWRGFLVELGKLGAEMASHSSDAKDELVERIASSMMPLQFAPDDLRHRIGAYFRSRPGKVIFTYQGLHLMAAMSILYGSENGRSPDTVALGLLCLATNDYIADFRSAAQDPLDGLVAALVQSYRIKDAGEMQESLVRTRYIFSGTAQNPNTRELRTQIESQAFGSSFQYYYEAFGLPLMLMTRRWGRTEAPIVTPALWASATRADPNWMEANFSALVGTRETIRAALQSNTENGVPLGADVVLARYPLISINEHSAACISPHLLFEHFRLGVWARFRSGYVSVLGKEGSELWLRDFGVMFERWCRYFAQRAQQSSPNSSMVIELSDDVGSHDEIEDVILEDASSVAFFSCKASMLREPARIRENPGDTISWLEKFFFGDRARPGALRLLERKLPIIRQRAGDKRIEIVIVSYDSIGDSPAIRLWLERERAKRKVLVDPAIYSVRAFSVTEYEKLMSVTGPDKNPLEVLRAMSDPAFHNMSVEWTILRLFGSLPRPAWVLDSIGEYGRDAVKTLFNRDAPKDFVPTPVEVAQQPERDIRDSKSSMTEPAHVRRLTIAAADKGKALVGARQLSSALTSAGIAILRGEFVMTDGRLYIEIPATVAHPTVNELQEMVRRDVSVGSDLVPARKKADECINCGNVPERPFTVCPNCGFREISSCPNCATDVPRSDYAPLGGKLFRCPTCNARVRLATNDPLWREDGFYNEPAIVVTIPKEKR